MTNVPTAVDPKDRWKLPAPLAERLDCFARRPSQDLHESRQEPADRETLTRLGAFGPAAATFWHRVKSEALCAAHGLDDLPVPPLSPTLARVVLLNARELTALANLCGATLQAPWVRAAIGRDEVAQWRAALGESLYTFALRHAHRFHPIARMTPQMVTAHLERDKGAALDNVTARAHSPALGVPRIRPAAETIGWSVLASLAMRTPDAIGRRLALKLPIDALVSSVPEHFPGAPSLAIGQVQAARAMLPAILPSAPALASLADTDLLTFVASLTTCLEAPWLSTFDSLP